MSIDKKALKRKEDICVMEIHDWKFSTLGELLGNSTFQKIMADADNYYFDICNGIQYDNESEPPYIKIMKSAKK